ncbi:MAG: RNA 2',3'-cyclic phosphodiesterase [Bacteroidales bacterium]|jgi:2'-5' RNA ligase
MSKELELNAPNISSNDLTIIGITTTMNSFSLAQHINTELLNNLTLFKDFESYDKEKDQTNNFKNYYYYNAPYRLHNLLISNKNNEDKLLFDENKTIDYIYVLIGRDHRKHAKTFLNKIKHVPNIVLAQTIHPVPNTKKQSLETKVLAQTFDIFGEAPINITSKKKNKKEKIESPSLNQFIEDLDFNIENVMFEKSLFLAYKIIPNEAIIKLTQNILKHYSQENIKPIQLENYHLTIAFIGNISKKHIKNIIITTQDITKQLNGIEIEIDKIGFFEGKRNNLVIWFGIKDNEELNQITKTIRKTYKENNINYYPTSFHPHITIAKIKELKEKEKTKEKIETLFNIPPQKLTLTNPTIFESISIENTTRYDIIQSF